MFGFSLVMMARTALGGLRGSVNPLSGSVPYRDLIYQWAKTYRVDPCLIAALISVESSFDPNAVNPSDPSYGLGQVQVTTARDYLPGVSSSDLLDPATNIQVVCAHVAHLQYREGFPMPDGIGAYNTGAAGWRKGYKTTDPLYVQKIKQRMGAYC